MQKRVYERIPTNIEVSYGNELYSGTMTNCSENGMFINTRMCYPFDTSFQILIILKDEVLKVPVKVTRIVKTYDFFNGMGVELLNPSRKYLEFIKNLNPAL